MGIRGLGAPPPSPVHLKRARESKTYFLISDINHFKYTIFVRTTDLNTVAKYGDHFMIIKFKDQNTRVQMLGNENRLIMNLQHMINMLMIISGCRSALFVSIVSILIRNCCMSEIIYTIQ
jgi:hypothetical protein